MGNSFLIREIPSSPEALGTVCFDLTAENITETPHYQRKSQDQGSTGTSPEMLKAGEQLRPKSFAGFLGTRKRFIKTKL